MNKPKVILLDIETSPLVGYAWQTWDTSILKVLQSSKIISVAWTELGSKKVLCKSIADYPEYKAGVINDEQLVKDTWKVLDEADILVAHHGDAFDFKKLNARFVYHGLTAPSSYKTIDTKKVASKYFKFDGNSLSALGTYLNVGKKLSTGGFDLWDNCINGDLKAWKKMKEYNVGDVELLEAVYLVLRPFMENHPNLNAVLGGSAGNSTCPSCLSVDIHKRGFSITRTGRKQRFQCNACGSWSSGPYEKVKTLSNDDD